MTQQISVLRTRDDREIPVAGTYTIDPTHTSVEFIGRHLMITKVRGRFPDVSGTITIDDEPEHSHVEATIHVATLYTGDDRRDDNLRSPDFFDAEKYPMITFRSTSVEARPFGIWALTGYLTVRGVTRPVTLEVDFDGANAIPGGEARIAFSAATDVDREEWGLTSNVVLETGGVLVGKRVRIELNVQAIATPRTWTTAMEPHK